MSTATLKPYDVAVFRHPKGFMITSDNMARYDYDFLGEVHVTAPNRKSAHRRAKEVVKRQQRVLKIIPTTHQMGWDLAKSGSQDESVVVTAHKDAEGKTHIMDSMKLGPTQSRIFGWLRDNKRTSFQVSDLVCYLGLTNDSARKAVKRMVEMGIVIREGTWYRVNLPLSGW